jgi:Mg-chelatase subunit ChlD
MLPPGSERRFKARYILSQRGNHLWLRCPDGCPDKMLRLPNPWVEPDLARFAPEGRLTPIPYGKDEKFDFTPAPLFPEPEAKGIEGVGLTGKQVNDAIRKGAAWLAKRFERGFSGNSPEYALVILAMLHSGEFPKYPELQAKAIECLETRKFRASYDLALTAMGLAHVDPQRYHERIRNIAQALVDAQVEKGGWGYMNDFVRNIEPGLPAAAEEPEKKAEDTPGRIDVDDGGPIADWPGSKKTEKVTLKRTTPLEKDYCDNSCSQYAVLGLLAASHAGVHAPRETWERVVSWYLEAQSPRRGWGYGRQSNPTGSMTTAGIAGFAVARHVLGGLDDEQELALRIGMDWLARNYRLDDNPNAHGSWQYYYLYGLERAGRLLAKEFIGDHEWYAEGARYLVDNQAGDGSWEGKGGDPVKDTCFAILFLTRATEKLGETKEVPTGPGWLEVEARSASGALVFILDASFSMTADLGEETRFDAARRVVLEVLQGGGAGLEVALRAYGHRYRSNKPEARTDSELVVGFGPADRADLSAALAKLRCRGKTPLTYSVLESLKDLEGAKSKDRRVVLLTDGMESDRRAKPLEAAAAIREAGARLDVVCFCMDSTDLMEKMAAAGGGACYSAADAEQLLAALKTAVVGDVAFRVLDAEGKDVAKGKTGDRIELPAGPYTVEVALPGGAQQVKAWIHQDRTTKLRVR